MLLKLDPHLTADSATDKARFTHQGQAHFGGTGPTPLRRATGAGATRHPRATRFSPP